MAQKRWIRRFSSSKRRHSQGSTVGSPEHSLSTRRSKLTGESGSDSEDNSPQAFDEGTASSTTVRGKQYRARRGSVSLSSLAAKPGAVIQRQSLSEAADLVYLADPTHRRICTCLSTRFKSDEIYTNLGPCLLSINPFKWIDSLYTPEKVRTSYEQTCQGESGDPHVFRIASQALQGVMERRLDQAILITGESGSGKTENMKKCLQHFVMIAAPESQMEKQILATNPLLEAFGNAKTSRNSNSSRFGKWIELLFQRDNARLRGCRLTHYLLEKSRIVKQGHGDRNYHIFYMLCAAAMRLKRRGLDWNLDLWDFTTLQTVIHLLLVLKRWQRI